MKSAKMELFMRFCREPGNDPCLDLKRKGREQGKLQTSGGFRSRL